MHNISNLCTVVLPTFFPGDEIFENLKSIPTDLKIIIVDNSYNQSVKDKISTLSEKIKTLTNKQIETETNA